VKFLGVWLVAVLVTAALLFALTGTQDTLVSSLRSSEKAACDSASEGIVQVSKEDCLRNADETLNDIAQDAQADMLRWHFAFGVIVLLLGTVFMFQIVSADAVAGTEEQFTALKGTWFIYLAGIVLMMIVATFLARILDAFGKWATLVEPGLAWGIPALVGAVWIVSYWAGTKLATPSKMQPSIPPG